MTPEAFFNQNLILQQQHSSIHRFRR